MAKVNVLVHGIPTANTVEAGCQHSTPDSGDNGACRTPTIDELTNIVHKALSANLE